MFILGIRDQKGLAIVVNLIVSWFLTTVAAFLVSSALSWLFILFNMLATLYASFLFHRSRKSLKFNNPFARELAFPKSRRAFFLVLALNLVITLFCFVPPAAALLSQPAALNDPEIRLMMATVYVFGWLGILGLVFQYLSRGDVNDGV